MLNRINSWLIDIQIKSRFKPKHKKEKICKYCNKLIKEKQYGFWVDGSRNTEYAHINCEKKNENKIKETLKEICEVYRWEKEPSIERCLKCNKLEICKNYKQ